MGVESLPPTYSQEIPEEYRDQMGHMNVMWYTHLFACATWEFFNLFGMNEAYFRQNSRGAFAIEAHVRYLNEVHVGDRVTMRSRAIGRSLSRLHFIHFLIIDESEKLAATCEYVGVHVDMLTRRMAPIPQNIRDSFDVLLKQHVRLSWPPPCCGTMKP